jgi:hypothetical protein
MTFLSTKTFSISSLLVLVLLASLGLVVFQFSARYFDRRNEGIKTRQLEEYLQAADLAQPENDVSRNLIGGNGEYLGCLTNSGVLPGVPMLEWSAIWEKGNYTMIPGTADLVESRHHRELQKIAKTYAKGYNVALQKKRRESKSP